MLANDHSIPCFIIIADSVFILDATYNNYISNK